MAMPVPRNNPCLAMLWPNVLGKITKSGAEKSARRKLERIAITWVGHSQIVLPREGVNQPPRRQDRQEDFNMLAFSFLLRLPPHLLLGDLGILAVRYG
jgi:hypothetical protein